MMYALNNIFLDQSRYYLQEPFNVSLLLNKCKILVLLLNKVHKKS